MVDKALAAGRFARPAPYCFGGGGGKGEDCAGGGGAAAGTRRGFGFGLNVGLLRGGGPAGCSTTVTGLGVSVGGELWNSECSAGSPVLICTVCGKKPFFENETAWLCGCSASEQGVWQVCPCPVRTSAPCGCDSNCMVTS
jgi:hypothetical protein